MKILIIQTAFLGDVILATSLIEKLHHHFPDATIDFLLNKVNKSVIDNNPYIRKVLVHDKTQKYTSLWRSIWEVRKEQYTHVINVHRFLSSGIIVALSGASFKIGFRKNPLSFLYDLKIEHQISIQDNTHEIVRNTELVKSFTDDSVFKPKLYPNESDIAHITPDGAYICIAPASVWFTKQLPMNKWVELMKLLPPYYHIYLLGSKKDRALCEEIIHLAGRTNVFNVAGQLSILQSAALIQKASMTYANDSAPLHIASAMNAPITAVFCSTVPQFGFGPLSDRSFVVEYEQKLDCKPCGIHGKAACPEGHFRCSQMNMAYAAETLSK